MNRIHEFPLVAWVGFPPVADFFIIAQPSSFNLSDSEEQPRCITGGFPGQCQASTPNLRDDAMTDWAKLSGDLERLLKLRSFVFAMKLYDSRAEMEAIPRIRRPESIHTLDQVVGQASRLGWTVGITAENLVGAQCRAVVGLGNAKDEAWRSGRHMVGVWYSTEEDASAHQAAMQCVPDGQYEALAIAPLSSGRLDPPDIALFYATPGAMIYFINGLQWAGYKRFDWSVVGESACADSWVAR